MGNRRSRRIRGSRGGKGNREGRKSRRSRSVSNRCPTLRLHNKNTKTRHQKPLLSC